MATLKIRDLSVQEIEQISGGNDGSPAFHLINKVIDAAWDAGMEWWRSPPAPDGSGLPSDVARDILFNKAMGNGWVDNGVSCVLPGAEADA